MARRGLAILFTLLGIAFFISLVGFGLSVGLLVTRLARGAAAALAAPSRPVIVAGVLAAIGIPEALG